MESIPQARSCPPSEQIVAFVEGRLRRDAVRHLEHHIDECSGCQLLIAAATEQATLPSEVPSVDTFRGPERAGSAALQRGDKIGRYEIASILGSGGMGDVYLAHDPELERLVALKRLRRAAFAEADRSRIVREARLMARLSHPNVLPVFDVGVEEGEVFIAMHFARGGTLRAWLEHRRRSWREIQAVFLAAARGLAAAHHEGLIHRDFKPDNVLLDIVDGRHDHVFVVDFGLACDYGDSRGAPLGAEIAEHLSDVALQQTLTRTGLILGTPAYMAPEQHLGQRAGPAADQFAFCVALWEACYGVRPFQASDVAGLRVRKQGGVSAPPPHRGIPRSVYRVLEKGLRPRPEDRFACFDELIEALVRCRPRQRFPVMTGASICMLTVAAGSFDATDTCESSPRTAGVVWSAEHKPQLRQAFMATDVSHASESAAIVERQLDDYARVWTEVHVAACRTGDGDPRYDQRMHCLSRRLVRFEATVALLQTQTPKLIDKATQLTLELDSPDSCLEEEEDALTLRPYESVSLPRSLLPVRALLDEVEVQRRAGDYQHAVQTGAKAVALARELKAAPELLASVLLEHAVALLSLSRYRDLQEASEEAFFLARRSGYERLAMEAAVRLVEAGAQSGNLAQANLWMRQAEVAFTRSGKLPHDERSLAERRALLSYYDRDAAAGLAAISRAVELARQLEGEGESLASSLRHQADLYGVAGDHARAVAIYEEVLAIRRQYLPADHPVMLDCRISLADQHRELGEIDTARSQLRELLTILERSGPALVVRLADTLHLLATVEAPEQAISYERRAIEIYERVYDSDDISTINAYNVLGAMLVSEGRLDEGRQALEKGAAARERLLGAEHPDIYWDLIALAELDSKQGRFSDSLMRAQRAVDLSRRHHGEQHEFFAWAMRVLGSMHLAAGHAEEGCDVLGAALPLMMQSHNPAHPLVQEVAVNVGSCHLAQGRPAEALSALEAVLEADGEAAAYPAVRARVELQLARTYEALGRREDAAKIALEARQRVSVSGSVNEAEVARDVAAFIEELRSSRD